MKRMRLYKPLAFMSLIILITVTACKPVSNGTNTTTNAFNWFEYGMKWLEENYSIKEMAEEVSHQVSTSNMTPEQATDSLAHMFSITTMLKSSTLSQDDTVFTEENLLTLTTFRGIPRLKENFASYKTFVGDALDDTGKLFLDTGIKISEVTYDNIQQNGFSWLNDLFAMANLLEKHSKNRPIEEYSKFLQGQLYEHIFADLESPIYLEDGRLDSRFIADLELYITEHPDSSFNKMAYWIMDYFDDMEDYGTLPLLQSIYTFGTDRENWQPQYVYSRDGLNSEQYFNFIVAPNHSQDFINQVTANAKSQLMAELEFDPDNSRYFYFSQSFGTVTDSFMSVSYYGETSNASNERFTAEVSYLLDLSGLSQLSLKDLIPHEYETFSNQLNQNAQLSLKEKLKDPSSFDLTTNIPFLLSNGTLMFNIPSLYQTDTNPYTSYYYEWLGDDIKRMNYDILGWKIH